jgi:hypothetical protein
MGGPLLFAPAEPWPTCAEHPSLPLVSVLQIYRRDVPELPFPGGTDICQILWCPRPHDPDYGPLVSGRWTAVPPNGVSREAEPSPTDTHQPDFVPSPCTLSPETVTEYPGSVDLPEDLYPDLDAWMATQGLRPELYGAVAANAPGTKVGGWPRWVSRVATMECDRGHPMEVMVTVADDEWDGRSRHGWQPVEEQGSDEGRNAAGLAVGDTGRVFVFTCTRCDDRPMKGVTQP